MDQIAFFCTICGEGLSALPETAGGFCECPRCLRVVPIPGYPTRPGQSADEAAVFSPQILAIEIKFLCDCCGNKVRVDARLQGVTLECPVCQKTTKVPEWGGALPLGEQPARTPGPLMRLSAEEYEFLSTPVRDGGRALATAAAH